ncbi:MAG: hypothetical protein ACKOB2_07850 [Solirubrobacterales bacterium]
MAARQTGMGLIGAVVLMPLLALVIPALAPAAESEKQLDRASLQLSDIPSYLSKDPSREFAFSRAPATNPFEMCVDKQGRKVFGAAPSTRANAAITLQDTKTASGIDAVRVVSSDIYAYRSRSKAKQAWRKLVRATSRCAGKAGKKVDVAGQEVDAEAVQKVRPLRKGTGKRCGFSVSQRVSVRAPGQDGQALKLFVTGFSAYRVEGRYLVRTQLANENPIARSKARLKPRWRKFAISALGTVIGRLP